MKLAVIYDSKTGNTKQAAEWIAEGMRLAALGNAKEAKDKDYEVIYAKSFSIEEVDEEYVKEAKGVVIGSPSYATLITPDMRSWLMGAGKLGMAGKLGGAFATEQYTHGGGDLVIQSLLHNEMVWGMLCYSGGAAFGKPVIHLGPVGVNDNMEAHNGMEHYRDYFICYGQRFAKKALELFGK